VSDFCDCGFANSPAARFCGGCGRERRTAPSLAPIDEGARRQVTALFADLAGYTSLSARHDPEQVRDLLEQFFERVDSVTVSFGGSINQHIGDAILALFGAPVAHGNDAERAVAAALAIHEAVRGLHAPDGTPLAVHVGVASGVVVAASTGSSTYRGYTVTGQSVNLAARLMDLGTAGETLISDPVRRAVGDRLRARLRGEVRLKGIPEPVRVWSVDGLDPAGTVERARSLVGRQPERTRLAAALDSAREQRVGEVIVIRGEPGIGKSSLAREAVRLATEQRFTCSVANVLDFGARRGRDAVHQLALGLLGLPAGYDEAQRRDAARLAVASGRVAEGHAALLSELLDVALSREQRLELDAMDERTRHARRAGVLTSVIEAACAEAPVLILVEDVHWADRSELDAIAAAARLTGELPLVVVVTSRIDGDPIDDAMRARFHPARSTTLDLGPLQPAEALELAQGLGARGALSEAYVARAAGNPLFLEQLVRHAEDVDERSVPPSIQSLILARCDLLAVEDRAALQAASVLGQRFTLPALRHLLDHLDYRCDRLLARHLVRPDDEGFMFDHALIRECVYESMLRPHRQRLHRRAAEWFGTSDLVLHAEHLDCADDPDAARALTAAARAEFASYRGERALELAQRALARATAPEERAEIACLTGEILQELGRADAAIHAYEGALDASADEVSRCRARIGLAAAMRLADRLDDAYAQLDLAERAAEQHGLVEELSRLHFLRGNLHFPLGRIDLCRREHDLALSAAEASGRPELLVNALGGVGDAAFAQGRFLTALDSYRRCVELARERGLGRVEVANHVMIATCLQLIGPGGLAEAEAALAAAARVGHRRAEILALHAIAYDHFWSLRCDFGQAPLRRAVELCDRFGLSRFRAQSLAYLGLAEHLAGNVVEAERLLETAVDDSRRHSTRYFHLSVIGTYLQVVRDPGRRRELLAEGDRLSSGPTLAHDLMHYYRGAIDAALASDDWSRASRYADRLEEVFAAEPVPRIDACVRRGRALASWGKGERDAERRRELELVRDEIVRMDLGLYRASVEQALAAFDA
jgi:class 3 adenylate cyclase/tetratricopeptide (TPR) repeat protein